MQATEHSLCTVTQHEVTRRSGSLTTSFTILSVCLFIQPALKIPSVLLLPSNMKTLSEANEDSECLLKKSFDDTPEFKETQYEWRKPPSLARHRILIFGLSVVLVVSNTCWVLLKIFEQTDYGQNLITAKLDYCRLFHACRAF